MHAGLFAAFFAALYAAHEVGDHWVQTQHQADTKHTSWGALIGHVTTYTITAAAALGLLIVVCGIHLDPAAGYQIPAGLALSALTHGWADRRSTLAWLADKIGSGPFYGVTSNGINGAYLLDRSFHIGWLFLAALVMAA